MTKKKQKLNPTDIVEHAFHMPITYAEQREHVSLEVRGVAISIENSKVYVNGIEHQLCADKQ
jgi:hypothetical protein